MRRKGAKQPAFSVKLWCGLPACTSRGSWPLDRSKKGRGALPCCSLLGKLTTAQALQRAGYRPGLFGKWHLGQDGEHHPAQHGFEEAIVSMGRHFDFTTVPPTHPPADACLADWLTERANLATTERTRAQELSDRLQAWRVSIQAPMPTRGAP